MKKLGLAMLAILCATGAQAGTLNASALRRDAAKLIRPFHGNVGFCARAAAQLVCQRGDDTFPMQSVMKFLVAVAVMDAVDHGSLRLDEAVTLHLSDLSMNVQPIADLVRKNGSAATTIDDLMTRAVVDSDSAAVDFLIARLGGPQGVQAVLQRLADGTLLSRPSCAHLMDVLSRTRTFPGRLKAGLQPGWGVAHKTGTGGTVDGITSAANDVGVLTAPDGGRIAVAVFVTGTSETDKDQDALMASLARAVVKNYRPD